MVVSILEYTPCQTSRQLISATRLVDPQTVADFCAGNGSLLMAAMQRWPNAKYFANDIDLTMQGAVQDIIWVSSDFLSSDFETITLSVFPERFDLIVLNPPFSFHCTQRGRARGKFSDIECSVAFAFLFTALNYLSDQGELLAVMPTSTLKSERDMEARKCLKQYFKCRIISEPSYDRFSGLDVSTYLVGVSRKRTHSEPLIPCDLILRNNPSWTISRGNISVKRSARIEQSGLHGWIHTTSITSSRIRVRYELPRHHVIKNQRFLPTNSLIIPRVGKIRPGDIVLSKRREILSDCLLGITFDDSSLPPQVLSIIKKNFSSFTDIYSGTGAPYTTHLKVSRYIEDVLANDKRLFSDVQKRR